MTTATSPAKFLILIAAAILALCGSVDRADAQSPDTENGRYALSPAADGVIRLDTRTGAVATYKDTGTGWACVPASGYPLCSGTITCTRSASLASGASAPNVT